MGYIRWTGRPRELDIISKHFQHNFKQTPTHSKTAAMSTAQQQKAVFVKEIGKPVELGTREVPSPKEGQILLKVASTMCRWLLIPND